MREEKLIFPALLVNLFWEFSSVKFYSKHFNKIYFRGKSLKVKRCSKLGRFMVAARDLKAGEILFRECAVVHGPKMFSHPICLGCHKTLNKFNLYRCSRCKWPMCAKSCESLQPHIDECQLMSSKNYRCPIKTNQQSTADGFYSLIFPLRFLLLKVKQPKTWVDKYEK